MAALRSSLYLGNPAAAGQLPRLAPSLVVSALFAAGTFLVATGMAQRSLQ